MRPSWFKISALLAGLWALVGGSLWWLEARLPSPEKVLAFALAHRVEGKPEAERARDIQAVAAEYQKLDEQDRREMLSSHALESWWTPLTLPERRDFRLAIFPQSRRFIETFDKMDPDARRRNVDRMMREIRRRGGDDAVPNVSPMVMNAVVAGGLKTLFEGTLFDQKMDTLLMLHELEKSFLWHR